MTKITKLTKSLVELDYLPVFDPKLSSQQWLDDACRAIVQHYRDLKGPKRPRVISGSDNSKKPKYQPVVGPAFIGLSANANLKRLCYRLTILHIEDERFDELKVHIERFPGNKLGRPTEHTNPFKTCLSAVFAHDREALDPRDKLRFAEELYYAYRHFVPLEDLERFICFCGSESIGQKLKDKYIEPLFADRVIINLKDVDIFYKMLGEYPKEIRADSDSNELSDFLRQRHERAAHASELKRKKRKKKRKKQKKKYRAENPKVKTTRPDGSTRWI